MSTRNDRAWNSYDNWLLKGSGVDDNYPEVFETDKHKLFSCDEDNVAKFNDEIEEIKRENGYNKLSYDSFEEYFTECLENLADELGLHDDISGAEVEYWENYQDEKEYAKEQKAERKMQARKDGEF